MNDPSLGTKGDKREIKPKLVKVKEKKQQKVNVGRKKTVVRKQVNVPSKDQSTWCQILKLGKTFSWFDFQFY